MLSSPLAGPVTFPPGYVPASRGSVTVTFESGTFPVFVRLNLYVIVSPIAAELGPLFARLMPGAEMRVVVWMSVSLTARPRMSPSAFAVFTRGSGSVSCTT